MNIFTCFSRTALTVFFAVTFTVFFAMGEMKQPEGIPNAPQAPGADTPFVKEVAYYEDWQLTKPLSGTVSPGTTFFMKVVFSEPMKFKAADDDIARPILYYRINGELIRFRIAKHGAGGEDFVSGDGKPWHGGVDDYICKYTVPADVMGEFTVAVGKLNADRDGNTLPAFYTHQEKLHLGQTAEEPSPTDTTPPTVLSIAHYHDGNLIAEDDTVPEGVTIATEIIFSERVIPTATHTTGGKTKAYTISQTVGGVHWRGVCKPTDPGGTRWLCRQNTSESSFSVTVTTDTADLAGNHLAEIVMTPEITVTERGQTQQLVPQPDSAQGTAQEPQQPVQTLVDAPDLHVVVIPDPNLRKAVVATINELGIFLGPVNTLKGPADPIYAGEMRRIKYLTAESVGIEWLAGLEYATNLEVLRLGNVYGSDWNIRWVEEAGTKYRVPKPPILNRISDLTPLENLMNLTSLDLSCNAVSNLLPLSNLSKLVYLHLTENKITDIRPLAGLINLKQLYIDNHYYSPQWAGNNEIKDLTPLRNLRNLQRLDVGRNPIESDIGIVRNFPKLQSLDIGCCGVSNLRPLVEGPGLRESGSRVYLVDSPLPEQALGDIKALTARGVEVTHGLYYREDHLGRKVFENYAEQCSLSFRESLRAAPALQPQLRTRPDMLSSVWHDLSQVPEETALMPNYPNPFNPETWIPYQLAMPGEVTVVIHAADGQLVRTLALGYQDARVYQSKGRAVYWDGRNAQGEPVASGIYFYTLMVGDFTATRKLLIRK